MGKPGNNNLTRPRFNNNSSLRRRRGPGAAGVVTVTFGCAFGTRVLSDGMMEPLLASCLGKREWKGMQLVSRSFGSKRWG